MYSRLRNFLTPPVFENDEDKTVRAQLLYYVVTTLTVLALSASLLPLVWPLAIGSTYFYVFLLGQPIVVVLSVYLARRGWVRAASFLVVCASWVFITALAWRGGGVRSNFYPGYLMVMVIAGLLLGRRGSFAVIISSIAAGLVMVLAVGNGTIASPSPVAQQPMTAWIATTFFLAGAAALQNTSNRVIRRAMKRSIQELKDRRQAEETLSRERNLLRAFIDHLPDIVYVKDRDSHFLLNNAVSMRSLGVVTQEELAGKSDFDFFSKDLAERWRAEEEAVMDSNAPILEREVYQPWRTEKRRWVSESLIPLRDAQGQVIGIVGISRDITEHKVAEETLSRERNLLRTLIDNLPENIYIKDRQSRFLLNNAVSMRLLNVTRQEDLIGKSDFDFFPREVVESWYAQEQAVMESGEAQLDVVEEYPWSGDQRRWVIGSMIPLRDANNEVIGLLGMNRNITESMAAEEALRLSEQRYRMLVENLPDSVIILYDRDLRFVLVDGPEVENAGYTTANQMIGKILYEAFPPEISQLFEANMKAVLEGKTFSAEIPFGDLFYRYHYVPLHNEQGEIAYGMILGQNITARKKAEEALRESEESAREFQKYLRVLYEVSIELSKADTFDDLCRMAVELGRERLGFDRMGLWFLDKDPAYKIGSFGTDETGQTRDERHIRTLVNDELNRPTNMPISVDKLLFVTDSGRLYDEKNEMVGEGWNAVMFMQSAGQIIGYISADNLIHHQPMPPYQLELLTLYGTALGHLCTRKRAEDALRLSEERLRAIISNAPVILFSLDPEGVFTLSEGQGLSKLGLKPGEVVGRSAYDVYKDYPNIVDLVRQAMEGKLSRAPHDVGPIVFDVVYTPLRGSDGQITSIIGVGVDITERTRAEKREQAITRGLRGVVEAADELITIEDTDTFFLRAVELAREKLKVERCAIFMLDSVKECLIGTYGTDDKGQTTDERALKILLNDNPELVRRYGDPWWVTQDGRQTSWDGEGIRTIGSGWIATTIIRIGDEPIGIFSNDAAISDSAIDPTQQESLVIYCSLLGNILKRKRAEEALRDSEEVATEFQERLRTLHEISLELSSVQTLDDLYYRAVDLGVRKLGFERLGLFLFDEKHNLMGIYGTDESGGIRDERHLKWHMADDSRELELVREGIRAKFYENVNLKAAGEVVGTGWDALAILWNGTEGVGLLSTDNYFTHQPPRSYTVDLLALYGNLLGNLITQKQTQANLRESENRYRTVSGLMSDYAFAYDVREDGSLVQNWITEDSFRRTTGYTWKELETSYVLYHEADIKKAAQDVEKTLKGAITAGEYRIVTKSGEMRWLYLSRQPEWDAQQNRVIRFYGVAQDITERKRLEAEIQQYTLQLEQRVKERTAELSRAKEQIEAILNNISDAIVLTDHRGQIQTANPAFQKMFGDRVSTAIEDFLTLVSDSQQAVMLAEALAVIIQDGGSKRSEARVTNEEGQEIDLDLALISINETDDENAAILLSAHDITYLKDLERFKTRFVANAVHDLSSPITSLGTRLYLLKKTPERMTDHVALLEDQIQHLRDLVLDLRSLSELDRGLVSLNLEPVNLNDLVTKVFQQYELVAQSKNVQLSISLTPDIPLAQLDERKCERVIVNLITNAIHYTPDGEQIRVRTTVTEENLILTVEDEGIGISKEDLPHIFERFYRSNDARSANRAGTGLGLAIVKEMVVAHGGTITAESELGKGSTFTVKLPLHAG